MNRLQRTPPQFRALLGVFMLFVVLQPCGAVQDISQWISKPVDVLKDIKFLPPDLGGLYFAEPDGNQTVRTKSVKVSGAALGEANRGRQAVIFLSQSSNVAGEKREVGRATIGQDLKWQLANQVQLTPGENYLFGAVDNRLGEPGSFSIIRLWYDDGSGIKDPRVPVPLTVDSPHSGVRVYTSPVTITGKGTAGAWVQVDGGAGDARSTAANARGEWSLPVELKGGTNTLQVHYKNEPANKGVSLQIEYWQGLTFLASPVSIDKVTYINWYGNTEYAYENRDKLYSALQGLHSGVDFGVPWETPITNTTNRTGTVLSVNNAPYGFGAEPNAVLLDFGEYLVLYGHNSSKSLPKAGQQIQPRGIIAYSGIGNGFLHLHLEVILRNPQWENLPADTKAKSRPGDNRTNPVPFFVPELVQQLKKEKDSGAFHPTSDGKRMTPEDQLDITPGGPYLVP
ncbi:MAG: M23 family metallopeptidase [Actinobacteria bacterium]|nr:M23 family metallopeptidase [Actinomycetota bacterium]